MRDEMEAQDESVYVPPMPDVTAALLDFAQFSQRGGLAAPNEAGLIAIKLLERLLTLCNAQRGTVLLTTQHFTGSEQSSRSSISPRKMFRSFALYGLSDEEAMTMATHFALDGADIQVPSSEPGWLMWRLPVTAAFLPGQIAPYMQEYVGHSILPLYALTIVWWTGGDECARVDKVEHARALLPRVTSAFGAAILNVLQAERIHELEMVSDRKALREMELFKAELLATVSHEL